MPTMQTNERRLLSNLALLMGVLACVAGCKEEELWGDPKEGFTLNSVRPEPEAESVLFSGVLAAGSVPREDE